MSVSALLLFCVGDDEEAEAVVVSAVVLVGSLGPEVVASSFPVVPTSDCRSISLFEMCIVLILEINRRRIDLGDRSSASKSASARHGGSSA